MNCINDCCFIDADFSFSCIDVALEWLFYCIIDLLSIIVWLVIYMTSSMQLRLSLVLYQMWVVYNSQFPVVGAVSLY